MVQAATLLPQAFIATIAQTQKWKLLRDFDTCWHSHAEELADIGRLADK